MAAAPRNFDELAPWKQRQLNRLTESMARASVSESTSNHGEASSPPQKNLLALPDVLLCHVLGFAGVAAMLCLESVAKPAAKFVAAPELWVHLLHTMFTDEAARAWAQWAATPAGLPTSRDRTWYATRGGDARRAVCTLLRVPLLMWGEVFLPQPAQDALDNLERHCGVVECDICWPVALRPSRLGEYWSATALAQLFLLFTELLGGKGMTSAESGGSHEELHVELGLEGDTNSIRWVPLLALSDAIRRTGSACNAAMLLLKRHVPPSAYTYFEEKQRDLVASSCAVPPWIGDGSDSDDDGDGGASDEDEDASQRLMRVGRVWAGVECRCAEDIERHAFDNPPYSFTGPPALVDAVIREVLFGGVEGSFGVGWTRRLHMNETEEEVDECDTVPWGGPAWDAGREWWGCYCWVVLRALAPQERASRWRAEPGGGFGGEHSLAMLKVHACTTD